MPENSVGNMVSAGPPISYGVTACQKPGKVQSTEVMTTSVALVSKGFSLMLVLFPGGLKESFWVSNNALLSHFVYLRSLRCGRSWGDGGWEAEPHEDGKSMPVITEDVEQEFELLLQKLLLHLNLAEKQPHWKFIQPTTRIIIIIIMKACSGVRAKPPGNRGVPSCLHLAAPSLARGRASFTRTCVLLRAALWADLGITQRWPRPEPPAQRGAGGQVVTGAMVGEEGLSSVSPSRLSLGPAGREKPQNVPDQGPQPPCARGGGCELR